MATRDFRPSRNQGGIDFLFILPWFGPGDERTGFPTRPALEAEFPFSIAVLMARVQRGGYRVSVLDLNVEPRPLEALSRALDRPRPRIVGISSYSANVVNAETIARKIKELTPNVPVVLGGFHASALPEECLRLFPSFDYVMHGEVEHSLPELLESLLNGRPIEGTPNLAYREDDRIVVNPAGEIVEDLDEQPFPSVEAFDISRYVPRPPNYHSLPTIGLMSSRGCPFRCTFCATHFHWNRNVRAMSRGLVVDWMGKLHADYGIRDFRFYDDTFTLSEERVVEFCEELLGRNLRVYWNCYSRVDTINERLAKLMARAGCYHIKFGIEAGTERSLKRIKKSISRERALEAVKMTQRAGMVAKASFILGIHDESIEDSEQTIALALELDPDWASFRMMEICPGSEDFETWQKEGRIPEDFRWEEPLYATDKDLREMKSLLAGAYRRFYLRPGFLLRQLRQFLKQPRTYAAKYLFALRYLLRFRMSDYAPRRAPR